MFDNPTVSLIALGNSCANISCCSSELIFKFRYAASSIQNSCEQLVSCIHLSFVNFALDPTPQTEVYVSRFKQLYLDNHSDLDTCSYELSCLTMTDTITSQNNDFSSWITLYILRITLHILEITLYTLRITLYILEITLHILRIALHILEITLYILGTRHGKVWYIRTSREFYRLPLTYAQRTPHCGTPSWEANRSSAIHEFLEFYATPKFVTTLTRPVCRFLARWLNCEKRLLASSRLSIRTYACMK